jgi:hypothetical protein
MNTRIDSLMIEYSALLELYCICQHDDILHHIMHDINSIAKEIKSLQGEM